MCSLRIHARRCGRPVLACLAVVALAFGCGDDAPNGPGGGGANADTSSLQIVGLHHTGYDADGEVETGLTLQWTLSFSSTTGRDCRIQAYRLLDEDGVEVLYRSDPTLWYIADDGELSDKEVWIPITGPTSSGDYTFVVYYETGRLLDLEGGHHDWHGPLSTASAVREFTVVPKR